MPATINNNGGWKRQQLWSNAIRVAVMRAIVDGEPTKKLQSLAEKTVELGLAGDMAAIKEIGDRLDGRPSGNDTLTIDAGQSLIALILAARNGAGRIEAIEAADEPQHLDIEPEDVRIGSPEGEPGRLAGPSP